MGLLRVRSRSAPRGRGCRCGRSRPGCRAPCRCAGRGPGPRAASRRTCGRCPRGSRRAARGPASSPATRIGVEPSHSVSQSETLNAIVPPSPSSPPPILGWKRSMCRRSQSPCGLPVLVERVEHLARAGDVGLALAASPGTGGRGRPASSRPDSFVCCSCSVKPSCLSASSRSSSPKMTSSRVRAECRSTTSSSASRCSRLRIMLMIGVMPEPAETNRSFSGSSSGSTNSPSTPPSETMLPGRPRRTRLRRDDALVDVLDGDRDAAVGTLGVAT